MMSDPRSLSNLIGHRMKMSSLKDPVLARSLKRVPLRSKSRELMKNLSILKEVTRRMTQLKLIKLS